MVWGCITYYGVGQFAFVDSTMDVNLFICVLDTKITSTCNVLDLSMESMVLQQDNDSKHTSKIAKKYLEDNNFNVLKWQSCSPDMNPIENV